MSGRSAIGALDIGGTKISVGIVDDAGRVLARDDIATDATRGFEHAMSLVRATFDRQRSQTEAALRGIGIGCTGPVDPLSGEIGDVEFLTGWQGCNPVRCLSESCAVSVAMENDADAAALGEAQFGAGKDAKNLIFVTIGTGIGGGILLDGKLYRGTRGLHPELGHHVIDPSGPRCFCGAHGCWEALARGPAIAERFRATSGAAASVTARDVCDLARRGNPDAVNEIALEARYLGIGLANLITLYAPDAIVLGGSVMESADLFLPTIREIVSRHCTLVPAASVDLRLASLRNDAALIGASVVWRQRFAAY